MKMADISEGLKQGDKYACVPTNKSTEYLLFNDDYTLTPRDEEALEFIRHSYPSSTVVDIDNTLVTIEMLQRHTSNKWLFGDVIDAYAKISGIENKYTSVLTTYQSRLLLGTNNIVFDPNKKPSFAQDIAKRCATQEMIFIPFNALDRHWSLLVLNIRRREIQILNSMACSHHSREKEKETILVKSIQACIKHGTKSPPESTDITRWDQYMYTNIPQQQDSNSCGVYVIKYMLLWNGFEMRGDFTQEQMDIFRQKICCRLLFSECNRLRKDSYSHPITKQEHAAQNRKDNEVQGNELENDLKILCDEKVAMRKNKGNTTSKRARGRPQINVENDAPAMSKDCPEKEQTGQDVQRKERRKCKPSACKLSPFRPK